MAIIWLSFSNSPLTYNELFFIFIDGIISFVLIATNLILLSTIITFVFLRVLSNSKIKLKEALFLTSLVHSAYSFIPLIIVLFLPIFAFIVLFILVFFTLAGIIFLVIIFLVLIAAYIITNYFTLSKMYPKDKSLLIILLTIHFFLVLIILSILVGFFSLVSILAVFSGFM